MTHRPTYAENLVTDLDTIEAAYIDILGRSRIEYVNPNRGGRGIIFVGAADYGWASSDGELESARMALLRILREWSPRLKLLFPHPTPEVAERLEAGLGHLERWLIRADDWDHSIPSEIPAAQAKLTATAADLRDLMNLLPPDDYGVRLVVDTNALIDNPDVAAYTRDLGARYVVHLLPVVMREIDELTRGGRNPDVRGGAQRAERRLKGIRNNGDVRAGVRVAGDVVAKFEHVEPRSENLPDWLDMTVPDDRFVASTLLLQSDHPGSALYVATSDINMQTKLAVIGLPFVEPPAVAATTLTDERPTSPPVAPPPYHR